MYKKNKKQLDDAYIYKALSLWNKYLARAPYSPRSFQKHCLDMLGKKTPFHLFYACQVVLVHCSIRAALRLDQSQQSPQTLCQNLRSCLNFFNLPNVRAGYGQMYLYRQSIEDEIAQIRAIFSVKKTSIYAVHQIVLILKSLTDQHICGKRFCDENRRFMRYLTCEEKRLARLLSSQGSPYVDTAPSTAESESTDTLSKDDTEDLYDELYPLQDASDDNVDDASYSGFSTYSLFSECIWAHTHTALREDLADVFPSFR